MRKEGKRTREKCKKERGQHKERIRKQIDYKRKEKILNEKGKYIKDYEDALDRKKRKESERYEKEKMK